MPQQVRDSIVPPNPGTYSPPRPPPPEPSLTVPPPNISAETWQHLPMSERKDMLAEYQAGLKVVSETPELTPITSTEGLLDLHRGDWRSSDDPNNPVALVHQFLTTNNYLDPTMAGGANGGYGTYYGHRTQDAVKEFQRDQGLKPTGIIDQATLDAMQDPARIMDRSLRGPAGTYRPEIGDPLGPSQTLANGSIVQQFEHGKIVRDGNTVTAYGADGWPIPLTDLIAKHGSSPEAKAALKWAADQMIEDGGSGSGVNTNVVNGKGEYISTKDGGEGVWNSWCLAFVSSAYGRDIPELDAADAKDSMAKFDAAGRLVTDPAAMTPGAPVFFEPTSHNSGYGHIAIYTGDPNGGDPMILTTGWEGFDGIRLVPLSELERRTGPFAGWGMVVPP